MATFSVVIEVLSPTTHPYRSDEDFVSPRVAVGIEVKGHPVADVSGLSVPENQALSFYDPTPFRVDPSKILDAQKAIMTANGQPR
jgi:hypothetical protein